MILPVIDKILVFLYERNQPNMFRRQCETPLTLRPGNYAEIERCKDYGSRTCVRVTTGTGRNSASKSALGCGTAFLLSRVVAYSLREWLVEQSS